MARSVDVIVAAHDRLSKKFGRMENRTKRFKRSMWKLKAAAVAAAAAFGYAAVRVGISSVKAASEAEEVNNRFTAVFRNLSDEVGQWSDEFANKFGFARSSVKDYLAALQDTFVPMGFARDQAAELSKSLTGLIGDMSSFYDIARKDVLQDLQSAIVGNHRSVRKYGIVISESRMKQFALNEGIIQTNRELTEQEKVMTRYKMILEGTKDAQGDLARTQGTWANTLRRLKGTWQNLRELLGTPIKDVLTPLLIKFEAKLADIAERWSEIRVGMEAFLQEAFVRWNFFGATIRSMWDGVTSVFKGGWAVVKNIFVQGIDALATGFANLGSGIKGSFLKVIGIVGEKLRGFINANIRGINKILNALSKLPKIGKKFEGMKLKELGEDFGKGLQESGQKALDNIDKRTLEFQQQSKKRREKIEKGLAQMSIKAARERHQKRLDMAEQRAKKMAKGFFNAAKEEKEGFQWAGGGSLGAGGEATQGTGGGTTARSQGRIEAVMSNFLGRGMRERTAPQKQTASNTKRMATDMKTLVKKFDELIGRVKDNPTQLVLNAANLTGRG